MTANQQETLLEQLSQRLSSLEATVQSQNETIRNLQEQNKEQEIKINQLLLSNKNASSPASHDDSSVSSPAISSAAGLQSFLQNINWKISRCNFVVNLLLDADENSVRDIVEDHVGKRLKSSRTFEAVASAVQVANDVKKFLLDHHAAETNNDAADNIAPSLLSVGHYSGCESEMKAHVLHCIMEGDVDEAVRRRDLLQATFPDNDVNITLKEFHKAYWHKILLYADPTKPELVGEFVQKVVANKLISGCGDDASSSQISFDRDYSEYELKKSLSRWFNDRNTSVERLRHVVKTIDMFAEHTSLCTNGIMQRPAPDTANSHVLDCRTASEESLQVLADCHMVDRFSAEFISSTSALRSVLSMPNLKTLVIKDNRDFTKEMFEIIRQIGHPKLRSIELIRLDHVGWECLHPLADAKQTTIPNFEEIVYSECYKITSFLPMQLKRGNDFEGVEFIKRS